MKFGFHMLSVDSTKCNIDKTDIDRAAQDTSVSLKRTLILNVVGIIIIIVMFSSLPPPCLVCADKFHSDLYS
jgi:hypothetical protein